MNCKKEFHNYLEGAGRAQAKKRDLRHHQSKLPLKLASNLETKPATLLVKKIDMTVLGSNPGRPSVLLSHPESAPNPGGREVSKFIKG